MEPKITSLKEMVGRMIVARIPALGDDLVKIKLLKVEQVGIWVESHEFNQEFLEKLEVPVSYTTLIQFVPFAGISFIVASVEKTALSESAFGLEE